MSFVSMTGTRVSPLLLVVAAALVSGGLALVSCQQQQRNVAPSTDSTDKPAPPSSAVPSPTEAGSRSLQDQLGSAQKQQQQDGKQDRVIWPVVDIDNQPNKSTLDVHVPIFFDMMNHNDKESGKSRLDLSVLQGLVTVNKDKARDQNGVMSGPVKVTVFGIPVYTSKGNRVSSRAAAAHRDLSNSIETARSAANAKADDMATGITEKVQRTNEKMLSSVSDIFDRLTSMMRRSNSQSSSAASSGSGSGGFNSSSFGQVSEQRQLDRNSPIRISGGGQQRDPRTASRLLGDQSEDRRSRFEAR